MRSKKSFVLSDVARIFLEYKKGNLPFDRVIEELRIAKNRATPELASDIDRVLGSPSEGAVLHLLRKYAPYRITYMWGGKWVDGLTYEYEIKNGVVEFIDLNISPPTHIITSNFTIDPPIIPSTCRFGSGTIFALFMLALGAWLTFSR